METNALVNKTILEKCFSEEELMDMGYEYTCQNFSRYLIYKKGNKYYLIDEIGRDYYKVYYEFADIL